MCAPTDGDGLARERLDEDLHAKAEAAAEEDHRRAAGLQLVDGLDDFEHADALELEVEGDVARVVLGIDRVPALYAVGQAARDVVRRDSVAALTLLGSEDVDFDSLLVSFGRLKRQHTGQV